MVVGSVQMLRCVLALNLDTPASLDCLRRHECPQRLLWAPFR